MNNPDKNSQGRERGNPSATERDRTRNTPGTDMQPEDAGTAASGNESGRGTAGGSPAPAVPSPTGSDSSN